MREIKFRAWDKINKTMCQVRDIDFLADGSINSILISVHYRLVVAIQISDEDIDFDFPIRRGGEYEIMQFTGLLDKNGKEIYEGDIYRYANDRPAVVEFEKGVFGYRIFNHVKPLFTGGTENKHEVIGNIYENPDLC